MAKTFTAPFAQTPRTATAVVTAATGSINTDAPTGTVLLVTAGSDGSILTRLTATPRATATATSLLLYISSDGGISQRLVDSAVMNAQTISTTTAVSKTTFTDYTESTPLRLAAADRVYVGAQVALAGGIVFRAEYTDF